MSELIDRQDVIARFKKAEDVFRQNGAKLEANGIHYALELVESDIEIPTVDAYPFEQLQELVKLNQQFAQEIAELKRPHGYEEAIKAIEISAKKAQEAIEVFKQGLDKAEEQAKQILNEIPTVKWICNPTYCYKCNQTNCGAKMDGGKE